MGGGGGGGRGGDERVGEKEKLGGGGQGGGVESGREQGERLVAGTVGRKRAKMEEKGLVFSFEGWSAWSGHRKRVRSLTAKSMKRLEHIGIASAFVPWLTAAQAHVSKRVFDVLEEEKSEAALQSARGQRQRRVGRAVCCTFYPSDLAEQPLPGDHCGSADM